MPAVIPVPYGPNSFVVQDAYGNTGWHILATDGTGYTSAALLLAAGKKPFSSTAIAGVGSFVNSLETKGLAAGGITPGNPYLISINPAGGGTPSVGKEIGGSDQAFVFGPGVINTLWVNLSVATDTPEFYVTW